MSEPLDLDRLLADYGDLAVTVGLNLQPGQRLLVIGPLATGGVALEAAPLVRRIVASAYRAGAPLVEVLWGDDALLLTRFREAPRGSMTTCSDWQTRVLSDHADAGHAVISVYANSPDLLSGEAADVVGTWQQAHSRALRPFRDRISRNQTNWSVVAAASEAWAARVFPDLASERRVPALWDAIARLCRLDSGNPVQAWQGHLDRLSARRDHLNERRYRELKYRGPGTDLTIGLPDGHLWVSARTSSRQGISFTANIPTEEVFTMPHAQRVDGVVKGTKPLIFGGTLIDNFSLTFAAGHVVEASAASGEAMLRTLIETDAGAARLGEIALVPHRSPISQSGILFFNTLFDENAASHLALGTAYKFTLDGGDRLTEDEFVRAGGNVSAAHVDMMIGSEALDIDGVRGDGIVEPVMRAGEFV
jgi:aminopeptidase